LKRLSLSIAVLAVLVSTTSCGSDDGGDDTSTSAATSQAATEDSAVAETEAPADGGEDAAGDTRFQDTLSEVNALFASVAGQEESPTTTDEANELAGLDDTTPLVFVDYTVLPEDETTGSFCLYAASSDTRCCPRRPGCARTARTTSPCGDSVLRQPARSLVEEHAYRVFTQSRPRSCTDNSP
jgi:hypothetical protein